MKKTIFDFQQVEVKRDLMKKACDYHIDTCRRAMTGDGVDRHLFALYVVSQYLKLEVPFLKTVGDVISKFILMIFFFKINYCCCRLCFLT